MLPALGLGPMLHPVLKPLIGWLEAKGKLAMKAGSRGGTSKY